MKPKKDRIIGFAFIFLYLSVFPIIRIITNVHAIDKEIEGVTKSGAFGCKSKGLIQEAHSALRAMKFEKMKNYMQSGNCWKVEPNIQVKVIGDTDWGSRLRY